MIQKKKLIQKKRCVCSDCINSFEFKKIRWVKTVSLTHKPKFVYVVPVCENCFINGKYELAFKDQKPVVDTSKWLEGEPTAKGNIRFYFLNKEGKKCTNYNRNRNKKRIQTYFKMKWKAVNLAPMGYGACLCYYRY